MPRWPRRSCLLGVSSLFAIFTMLVIAAPSAHADWPVDGLPVCTDPFDQHQPAIVPDGVGGVVIAWADRRDGLYYDLYAQRMTPSGDIAAGWPVNGVLVCAAARVPNGAVAPVTASSDGAGGAIIAWQDVRNGGGSDIYAIRVLGSGIIDPAWPGDGLAVCTSEDFQEPLVMVADGSGGAYLAWSDYRPGADERDIYAHRVTGTGSLAPGWPVNGLPVCTAPFVQTDVSIIADGSGGAIIAWGDQRAFSSADIYAQRLTASGTVAPGWPGNGVAVMAHAGSQVRPRVVTDGGGGAIVVWQDTRDGRRLPGVRPARLAAAHQPGGGRSGWRIRGLG